MAFGAEEDSAGLSIDHTPKWLRVRFDAEHAFLGFPIVGGTRSRGRTVLWHEVSNRELAIDVPAEVFLERRLSAIGEPVAPTFLTSASVAQAVVRHARFDATSATAVTTVGLGNALRAGDTPGDCTMVGTINVLCRVSHPLTDAAMLEALALVVEARTLAVREMDIVSRRSGAPASGTGTDCVIIAAPTAGDEAAYAGKHTALGHVIGASVRDAVSAGCLRWKEKHGWR
jgi:adenosylcobinamide amidohydrolase